MAYGRLRTVTKEQLQEIANNCFSIAGMIKQLGYKKTHGSSYYVVKKYLQLHDIKTDHWKGQGWSKDEQLKEWQSYNTVAAFKKHLLKDRGHLCDAKWKNSEVPDWYLDMTVGAGTMVA